MKIAIYETVHLDWVIPYAEIFAEENISVSFITSDMFKPDLEHILGKKNPRYTWHFLNTDNKIFEYSRKLFTVLKSNRFDAVILNSIDSRHLIIFTILALTRPAEIQINLHDINNFFKIRPALSIRTNIRSIGKKLLMYLTDAYIVNAEAMKDYMLKNNLTQKQINWLLPVYYNPLPNKKTAFPNTIVISGSIDKRRRNYSLVLEVIQQIIDRSIPVKWVFTGKPVEDYGAEIIMKVKELITHGADISYYEEEIPENEFQQIIADASLILSPLVSSTIIHDGIREVYGESKGSGNIYDAIRHAKPLIVPAAVTVPKEIVTSCIKYHSKDDLAEELLKILTNASILESYTKEAEQNSQNFSKEKIKKMFMGVFLKQHST